MAGHLHFAAPSALDYFTTLVAEDAGFPLLEAAVTLAQDDDPQLDVQGVLARVDELAERLRRRTPADSTPLQRLRLLNRYLFQELGFAGNVNDFFDPRNSFLPAVLESRRGIPISLAVLYIEIASHNGLKAQGVSFPGHFLVKVQLPSGDVVIDPFSGHAVSREALEERLAPFRQATAARSGSDEVPLGLYLQPATARETLARMLRNLKEIHRSRCDWPRLERVQARLVVLLPQAWEEHRNHALVLAQMGRHSAAADALAPYLQHCPDASDAESLHRHLAAWLRVS